MIRGLRNIRLEKYFAGKEHVAVVKHYEGIDFEKFTELSIAH